MTKHRPQSARAAARQEILSWIAENPGHPPYEIADALEMNRLVVVGYITKMHRDGLIRKERDFDCPDSEGKNTYGANRWSAA